MITRDQGRELARMLDRIAENLGDDTPAWLRTMATNAFRGQFSEDDWVRLRAFAAEHKGEATRKALPPAELMEALGMQDWQP